MRKANPTVPKGSRAHLDCRMAIDPDGAIAQVADEAQVRQGLLSAVTEHSRKRDYCTWRWQKSRLGSTVQRA
jgi:hypothetical protein